MARRRILEPGTWALLLIGTLSAVVPGTPMAASSEIAGRWLVEKKDAIVLVEAEGGQITGRVVWAKDRDGIKGDERLDTKNPKPELRARKVLGLEILSGLSLTPDGNGWHRGGRIYNPKTGKSYPVKVKRESPDRLRLRIGGSILGQTTFWTRRE